MDSPCIASCKLNNNKVCIGCFRHIDEIVDWNKKTDEQHAVIFSLIALRKQEFAQYKQSPTEIELSPITQQEWQAAKQRIAAAKK